MLVIVLRGIMDGTVAKSTAYINHSGADLFIAREGVSHMSLASSTIPEPAVQLAASVDGVSSASGVIRVNAIAVAGDLEQPAQLIGYDPQAPLGGPWRLSAGRGVESNGEVVADNVLARPSASDWAMPLRWRMRLRDRSALRLGLRPLQGS